jgi:hypothetical protein
MENIDTDTQRKALNADMDKRALRSQVLRPSNSARAHKAHVTQ